MRHKVKRNLFKEDLIVPGYIATLLEYLLAVLYFLCSFHYYVLMAILSLVYAPELVPLWLILMYIMPRIMDSTGD